MNPPRHYSKLDHFCLRLDQTLKSWCGHTTNTARSYPAQDIAEPSLTEKERAHAAALMRINHAGEVCAQALYHGQGLVSRRTDVREKMQHAATEEGDHLAWCTQRLTELGSHTSYLNPLWYAGSFAIGLTAGLVGDKWSLGFLAETEHQVVQHLENQLDLIPPQDSKTPVILQQMQTDEAQHRDDAISVGAAELPGVIKKLMALTSKLMVKIAYWV